MKNFNDNKYFKCCRTECPLHSKTKSHTDWNRDCNLNYKPDRLIKSLDHYLKLGWKRLCGNSSLVKDCYMYHHYKKEILEAIEEL